MTIRMTIKCTRCGHEHSEPIERLKAMVEHSDVDRFRLEHTCPACSHRMILKKDFADQVLRAAP